ncbi:MAG: hypothetical protein MJ090_05045 [Clostridia bacterium]|nr:hypothetical protein [Clostridia bacterium]
MKNTITVFRWICASGFILTAIGTLANKGYLGALFLVLGGIIILPLNPIIEIRNKLKLRKTFTIVLSIALFLAGVIVTPTNDVQTKSEGSISKTIVSETNDKTVTDSSAPQDTDTSSKSNVEAKNNKNTISKTNEKTVTDNSAPQDTDTSSKSNVEAKNNKNTISKNENSYNSKISENKKSTNSATNKKSNSVQKATDVTNNKNKNNQTVYITKTGKKYHSSKNCNGLSNAKSVKETTLSVAESSGLTPCLKCH